MDSESTSQDILDMMSDKTEYKYTIETSNDNAQGVFKVRVVLRSDELRISKTLEEANDIKIEEQKMSLMIAELVDETYKELIAKGYKTETQDKPLKTRKMETQITKTKTEQEFEKPTSEPKDTSLLLD